jgi:uncharacterized membrane protein
VVHHNLFEKLRAFDPTLMTLNLVFLALIALVPFSADLYDAYTQEPLAVAVLGATLGLAALANWLMTRHVVSKGLMHERHRPGAEPFAGPAGLGFTIAFLLSVPAAFVEVHLAEALWIATIFWHYPLRRLGRPTSSA